MDNPLGLGALNAHAVGIICKEMVRRAITVIREQQRTFEVRQKEGYGGTMDDLFTSADKLAQEVYLRSIRECFPGVGVIAEEDHLRIEPTSGVNAYFTVDPLDGTKAFVRRQSHGIGTMLSLVINGEVAAAYVGDVNTREVFGYRPGSGHVFRITDFSVGEELTFGDKMPIRTQYVQLRDPERVYSRATQGLVLTGFKNLTVDGGSIGTWLARLWKREVGAAILPPGWETPWDSTPVIGITRKLGYRFYRPDRDCHWVQWEPVLPLEPVRREHDLLIVHENDAEDLFRGATT